LVDPLLGAVNAIDTDGISRMPLQEHIENRALVPVVSAREDLEDPSLGGDHCEATAMLLNHTDELLGRDVIAEQARWYRDD
jgi:hypothetical protein